VSTEAQQLKAAEARLNYLEPLLPVLEQREAKLVRQLDFSTTYIRELNSEVLALQQQLAAERARLRDLETQLKASEDSRNFHRDRGITLLDAKYLDPRCHQGCQSLVWQRRLDVERLRIDRLVDALTKARSGLQWYREEHPEDDTPADDEMEAEIEAALAPPEGEAKS
jgi:septal ring factor EnvC (AmiA/AmiB activator)